MDWNKRGFVRCGHLGLLLPLQLLHGEGVGQSLVRIAGLPYTFGDGWVGRIRRVRLHGEVVSIDLLKDLFALDGDCAEVVLGVGIVVCIKRIEAGDVAKGFGGERLAHGADAGRDQDHALFDIALPQGIVQGADFGFGIAGFKAVGIGGTHTLFSLRWPRLSQSQTRLAEGNRSDGNAISPAKERHLTGGRSCWVVLEGEDENRAVGSAVWPVSVERAVIRLLEFDQMRCFPAMCGQAKYLYFEP